MKKKRNIHKSLMMITQFSINMIVPIVLCSFAGYYIDKLLGTGFVIIILFFVGAAAGFRNIYIMSKGIYEDNSEEKRKH